MMRRIERYGFLAVSRVMEEMGIHMVVAKVDREEQSYFSGVLRWWLI